MEEIIKKKDLQPPLINPEISLNIREFLQLTLSGCPSGICIFRRFERLMTSSTLKNDVQPIIVKHLDPYTKETLQFDEYLKEISQKELEKNIEVVHKSYSGLSLPNMVREEPLETEGKRIYLRSAAKLNMIPDGLHPMSFALAKRCNAVTPLPNDLLFIFISNKTLDRISGKIIKKPGENKSKNKKEYNTVKATKFCICSEQFLRMWTLVMHDWHETFDKMIACDTLKEDREKVLRDKLFKGNRLMTNSWLKTYLSLESEGKDMTIDESREKYWFYRTEISSIKWVDVYTSIILIIRYNELPCYLNVPSHLNVETKEKFSRDSWSLPPAFLSNLLKSAGIKLRKEDITYYEEWHNFFKDKIFSPLLMGGIENFVDNLSQCKRPKDNDETLKDNISLIHMEQFPILGTGSLINEVHNI